MSNKLRIIQPNVGNDIGENAINEKWLIVELQIDSMIKGHLTNSLMFGWFVEGFISWGTYSIKDNHTRKNDAAFYIGEGEPKKNTKIWRYKANERKLHFATVKTDIIGGGLEYGEKTIQVRDDIVLSNISILGKKAKLLTNEYGKGQVHIPSWIKPFHRGEIYWKPNDI